MDIISHKSIFLTFSGILIAASIVAVAWWGLMLSIDFTGGSLMEVEFSEKRPSAEEVKGTLAALDLGSVIIQSTGEQGMILRSRYIDESTHQEILSRLSKLQVPSSKLIEKRFDTIGPSIGKELLHRSWAALGVAVAAIILYIAWAFRKVSEPVASWKYGIVAVAALLHDILIPTGVFAALGHFMGVEVDALFVTALLTIMGFSVHDTIVVFDRIRENLRGLKKPEPFAVVVNRSIRETMARSLNTSLTVLLVLAAIIFWGGATTMYFALVLVIGITFGTYSSIFVASPLLVVWHRLTYSK